MIVSNVFVKIVQSMPEIYKMYRDVPILIIAIV